LVNPLDAPTTVPKYEPGIIVLIHVEELVELVVLIKMFYRRRNRTSGAATAVVVQRPSLAPDDEFQYIRNSNTGTLIAGSALTYDLAATDDDVAVTFLNGTGNLIAGIAVRSIPHLIMDGCRYVVCSCSFY